MKKVLFLALVLAMIFVLALSVSAAGVFTLERQKTGNLYDLYLDGVKVADGVIGQNNMPGNNKPFTVVYNGAVLNFVNGKDLTSSTTKCEALGCEYERQEKLPACTEDGYSINVCKVCKDVQEGSWTYLGAAACDWTLIEYILPTCTNDGVKNYKCTVCESTAYSHKEGDALGHAYYWMHDIPAATCTQESNHWLICTREGCDFDAGYVNFFPALGHIETLGVAAAIVGSDWNRENGSDAHFDVKLALEFTTSRGDDVVEEVVFEGAYYRNKNNFNLTKTFELIVGCYEVEVEVVLSAKNNNQGAVFSVASATIKDSSLICED